MTEYVLNEVTGFNRLKMPTIEYLNEILRYEDGELYWKIDKSKRVRAGSRAGSVQNDGYRRVRIDGVKYCEHHLAYILGNQQDLELKNELGYELIVDHIDGDKSNNKIENLRLVTISENTAKQLRDKIKLARNGAQLLTGVMQDGNRWCVKFTIRSKFRAVHQTAGTLIQASFEFAQEAFAFKLFILDKIHGDEIIKCLNLREKDQLAIDQLYSGELKKVSHLIRDFTIKDEFLLEYQKELDFVNSLEIFQ